VEFLIDLAGRSSPAGKRNVAVAVAKAGFVHIRSIERTVIITLEPRLVSQLTLATACYKVADLSPERTVLVAGVTHPECWVFPGYIPALSTLGWLVDGTGHAETRGSIDPVEHLVQ
jgi:hypothetical protein